MVRGNRKVRNRKRRKTEENWENIWICSYYVISSTWKERGRNRGKGKLKNEEINGSKNREIRNRKRRKTRENCKNIWICVLNMSFVAQGGKEKGTEGVER